MRVKTITTACFTSLVILVTGLGIVWGLQAFISFDAWGRALSLSGIGIEVILYLICRRFAEL